MSRPVETARVRIYVGASCSVSILKRYPSRNGLRSSIGHKMAKHSCYVVSYRCFVLVKGRCQ